MVFFLRLYYNKLERGDNMTELTIKLDTISKVKKFVEIVSSLEEKIDIQSGRYVINAKSIMGIFSVDLTKPLKLVVHSKDISVKDKFQQFVAA